MRLQPPAIQDFNFQNKIRVDVENKGFSSDEIQTLAGTQPVELEARGDGDGKWWENLWGLNRPPEIQDLKSEFGYQSQPYLANLISVAEAQGTPLEGMIKARSANYNFFIMQCGVYIAPEDGEKFEALKFEVHYKDKGASTFTMLPGPQTRKILELGGKVEIGFNGKGEFGFPEAVLPLSGAAVGASAKAEVETKFIVSFNYELKTIVADAYGSSTPFCKWLMHTGDNLRNDVIFYPVITTPKSVTQFDCEFRAYFKINHPDWRNAEFFLKPPMTVRVSE